MSYIGQTLPTDVFGGYTTDTFAGDGSATTFTLSQAPFNEQGLIVVINNVIQQPTTNYTVSGTTLTIVGTAVASGDVIYARHTGVALPIGEANALDLQGQSDKLILDADADTTISADTDDQIDFKLGGVLLYWQWVNQEVLHLITILLFKMMTRWVLFLFKAQMVHTSLRELVLELT
jgi:hypothetical protein